MSGTTVIYNTTASSNFTTAEELALKNIVVSNIGAYDPARNYVTGEEVFYQNQILTANKNTTGVFNILDWDDLGITIPDKYGHGTILPDPATTPVETFLLHTQVDPTTDGMYLKVGTTHFIQVTD